MKTIQSVATGLLLGCGLLWFTFPARANVPGGGTNGANVTFTDNGTTVTLANGIVSILCTKAGATINQINYTYNNGGGTQTQQLLAGGNNGGQLYWEDSSDEGLGFSYWVVANPANTGGNYAEIAMLSTSVSNTPLEVHFSMLRGSTGFYTTAMYSHASTNVATGMGECRDNIYAGSKFNWMSVDAQRNKLMEVSGGLSIPVQGAPVECYLWTNGIYQGRYEDKYKYSADLGVQRAWGWSSVGTGGLNVGLWNVSASAEYYNGGPMKRELMSHIGNTILNMLNGGHYDMGADGNFANGEVWAKMYGPYFIYCNNVTNTLTGTNPPAQALYNDALAQAAAEETAWPYYWFTNANYASAANRGTVTGEMAINDTGNPNASAAGMWVGLVQQPATTDGVFDFQEWMKPYQFWTQTDMNGNFTLSNVTAGADYTLYAFGPGTPDTFMSQSQTGGSPPFIVDVPSPQFAVTVPGGATTNLGQVTWTPRRVGPTVFEIGYPDRKGDKFRHGDDYWVGDIGPTPTAPSPIWSKWLEFPFDFPNGLNYVVGQNRWTTDWNFVQPVTTDSQGNYNNSSSTITFNLASAPANGAQASLYIGLASDYYSAIIVTVNGNNLGNVSVTGTPNNSIPTTGYYVGNGDSDTSIREGNNAAFSDERLTFSAAQLHAGANTINLGIRQIGGSYFADHAMYDYLRLELTGYVPPPPASVAAYAGDNCDLVCWPATPGATSYNVLRSTTAGSGYASITNGVIGPICGSGSNNATYLDTTAVNGATYYYEVCSINPTGSSTNSSASAGVTPLSGMATSPPTAPTGLSVTSSGHQSVALNWNPSSNASFYSIWRSTLVDNGGGSSNTLSTIILNNANTATSYTDGSPTDGSIYQYFVTATGPGGTSASSAAVAAVPLPASPASQPASLNANFVQTNEITLNWSAVSGAVGYAIYRATSSGGPYTYLQTVTETTYSDSGLNPNSTYFYEVVAVNAGGISANSLYTVLGTPVTPDVIPGDAQISIIWSASPGATNYVLESSTVSGGTYNTILSTTNTSYLNTGLSNGTTYYYILYAVGPYGSSPISAEASATPSPGAGGDYWIDTVTATAQGWNANSNWSGGIFPDIAQALAIVNASIGAVQTVDLNQPITIGALDIGSAGGAGSFNVTGNGGALTFDDRPGPAFLEQLSTSAGDTISAPVTVFGGLLVTNASANTFTLSGNISGATNGLTLNGAVTLSGANTFTGGTIINSNTVVYPGSMAANNSAWGSGTNTLVGGTVQFYGYGGAGGTDWGGCASTFNVPAGQTGTLLLPPRFGYTTPFSSALIGGGTLNVTVEYVRDYFTGNWSAFTGQINVSSVPNTSDGTGDFRINNANGYAKAAIYLDNSVNLYNINGSGQTIDLGELSGASGAYIGTGSSASTNPTWRIGAKNTTNSYAGTIANSGTTSLIKIGAGTFILTGTNNSYSGSTTVSAGTLLVNNAAGSATGSGAVTVANSGTLGGMGIISGAVTVNSGGTLAPGNPVGTLTLSNNLTLVAGAACYFNVGTLHNVSNSVVSVTGGLTAANNVIHLTAPSLFVGLDTNADYTLFNVAGSITGNVAAAPYWNVAPTNAANFTIVTGANAITLHYAYSGNTSPTVSAASASPATMTRNATTIITATVTQGTYPLSTVTVNASPIGGPPAVSLVQSNSTAVYTNTVTITAGTPVGPQTLTVIATDTTTLSGAALVPLTVVASNQIWNGLGANANWSSNSNWVSDAGPGLAGDSATFAGTTGLAPNLDNNYSLTGLAFNSTAGSFNLGSTGGYALTLVTNGVVNNSTNAQTLNVPVVLGTALAFNAAAGNLTFSQAVANGGNLVTVTGNSNTVVSGAISGTGGLLKTGAGMLSLAGANTYTNLTTVNAGTLNLTGLVPGPGTTTIGNAVANALLIDSGTLSQLNLLIGNFNGAVGAVYQTGGSVSAATATTYDDTAIGNIAGGFGYYDALAGTFTSDGIAVGGENNTGSGPSGTGGNGILDLNGGTVNDTGWLVMARGVTNETGVLNVFSGSLNYAGGGIVNCWGSGQTATINLLGGTVANTAAVGFNLNESGNSTNSSSLNLIGGIAQGNSVSGAGARVNFNGGTMQASANNASFMTGLGSVNLYSGGATINDNGYAIGISQALLAPAGSGIAGIASFTPGAGYIAPPIVTVVRGAGDTTGTGATAIAQVDISTGNPTSGQVTNVLITCPGVNYTKTPTFTLTGGGATTPGGGAATPATITGKTPTANVSGGFTKTGSGTVTLSGADNYTGGTTISAGTLKLLASAAPSPTPLLYFSFNDVSGNTVINQGSGGSAMNGTLTGTATIVSGGINGGNALKIPSGAANAAYVLISNSVVNMTGAASWSIAMWVRTTTAGGVYAYQGSGGWVSGNMTFYLNEGSDAGFGAKAGGVSNSQGWEEGTATNNDGNWHFLVMTCNGSTKAMYVDGNVDTIVASWASATGVGSQLWIGGSADTTDKDLGLGGMIDGVYVYNSALSQAQIQSLYTNNPAGPSVLPVATAVSVAAGATLDVGGVAQTIGSLTGPSGSSVILADVTNATGVLTVGNASNTGFAGTISGVGSLTKAGTGTLTLAGANSYTGATVINNGTLAVSNMSGSATGSGSVSVWGGATLEGAGTLAGPVTVSQSGLLQPGEPFGSLNLGSNLTLAGGSTTLLQIQHSPLANAAVNMSGTLTAGGVLVVTNIGAQALNGGDSFQLFNAANYAGAFSSLVLPALTTNLVWNTNTLMTSGTISVLMLTSPTFAACQFNGGSLTVSGSGGVSNWPYVVLATTNLTAVQWLPVATNQFDGNGNFTLTLTNTASLGQSQTFYKLQLQ